MEIQELKSLKLIKHKRMERKIPEDLKNQFIEILNLKQFQQSHAEILKFSFQNMISAKVKSSAIENLKKSTGLDGKIFNVTINVIAMLIAEVLSNNYHYLEAKQLLTDWDISEKIAKEFGDNYKSLKEYIDSED